MNEQIKKGASQYANFISNNISQTDGEKIKYYFSGSLAMLLLSSAKSIKLMQANSDGTLTNVSPEISVDENASSSFKKGIRPISVDIDIVQVDETSFDNKTLIYNLSTVKEHCDLSTTLCPTWARCVGTMYFDVLSDDRQITNHNVAVIEIDNGKKIIIVNPVDLMIHKFSEMLAINIERISSKNKYEKDIGDLACMFNGLNKLHLIPEDIKSYLQAMIERNSHSGVNYLQNFDYSERANRVLKDVSPYIDSEAQEEFKRFIFEAKSFNKEQIAKSMQ